MSQNTHSLAKDSCVSSEFSLSGDYILGGLFPVHSAINNGTFDFPVALECDRLPFSAPGYQKLQVMRFAVEEINNSSSILPGVSLGYQIFDHCSEVRNFPSVFDFLSRNGSVEIHVNLKDYEPKVVSVLGPYGSSETITIAPFFMMDLLPMVNYGSSSSSLSNKKSFPSFLRTVTSNRGQVQLIIRILQRYKWNWVAFIGCDNDYSQDALQLFVDGIRETKIYLAYQEDLTGNSKHNVILQKIKMLRINVIIIYTQDKCAVSLIKSAIENNIHDKVWIASDAWSLSKKILSQKGLHTIGTIIGIAERLVNLPGFSEFVQKSQRQSKCLECRNRKQDFRAACNQACYDCSYINASKIIHESPTFNFAIYSAVYVVAKALHTILQCDTNGCNETERVFPFKLLKEIKKSDFKLLDQHIKFDENGDPPSRYDIVFWALGTSCPVQDVASDDTELDLGSCHFQTVGSYDTQPDIRFIINETLIQWYTNGTIPVSQCSEDCKMGSVRRPYRKYEGCFECDVCPNDTYINHSADPYSCIPCKKNEWSDPGSTSCKERVVVYIRITEPLSILLLLSVSFMLFLTAAITILFARNYNTPVVRSAGGKMCFLMLGCLCGSGLSVFFSFGVPNQIKCVFRSSFFPIFYTVCLSCLTVRSFQIVCVFKMAAKLPRAYDCWVKYNGQWLFIAVASTVQLILCGLSFPRPLNDTVSFKDQIILICNTRDVILSGIIVLYAGFLGALCFIFSYMGTDLPKNYNEAKSITFSVLLFFISWISYLTLYSIHANRHLSKMEALSMLTSSYGILLSYFVPKSYIILFKPVKNTQAHFQSCIQDYTQKISRM
ncbi:taste receptor type 1 member 1-like [Conger conger]|uniref:taste receptor type 1 member 1-like n=1 Tax=Conger conger TaxID=82655 RepID=UPI002A5AFC9F|nr:taste receptor type 1 member 1-like [Conger conger]